MEGNTARKHSPVGPPNPFDVLCVVLRSSFLFWRTVNAMQCPQLKLLVYFIFIIHFLNFFFLFLSQVVCVSLWHVKIIHLFKSRSTMLRPTAQATPFASVFLPACSTTQFLCSTHESQMWPHILQDSKTLALKTRTWAANAQSCC